VASGRINASPASARYFESLAPGRHGRQPRDSWRHPGDTERHRETLEALEPFSKYVPDVYAGIEDATIEFCFADKRCTW